MQADTIVLSPEKNETNLLEGISPTKLFGGTFNRIIKRTQTKTTFYPLIPQSPESAKKMNEACKRDVTTFSPFKSPGTPPSSNSAAPLSAITNSGTKLNLHAILDNLAIYSDVAKRKTEFAGTELKEVLALLLEKVTEISELIECKENSSKLVSEEVTQDIKEENAKLCKASGKKRRKPSQQEAMAKEKSAPCSATKLVESYFQEKNISEVAEKLNLSEENKNVLIEQFKEFTAEWLHMIDFATLGNKAQNSGNLVFGTSEANSQMIIAEEYQKRLLSKGEKIKISVTAQVVKHHVPYQINVLLEWGEYKRTFTFNPFTRQKPIVEEVSYLEIDQKVKKQRLEEEKQKQTKINTAARRSLGSLFASCLPPISEGSNSVTTTTTTTTNTTMTTTQTDAQLDLELNTRGDVDKGSSDFVFSGVSNFNS